jgi:alkylation response protein AidB-like acyl-CoA dehydrogenase
MTPNMTGYRIAARRRRLPEGFRKQQTWVRETFVGAMEWRSEGKAYKIIDWSGRGSQDRPVGTLSWDGSMSLQCLWQADQGNLWTLKVDRHLMQVVCALKVFCNEALYRVVDRAVQLHGAHTAS